MTMKSLLSTASLALLVGSVLRRRPGPDRGRPSRRLFRCDVGRRNAVRPGRRRHLCLDQQERRRRRQAGRRRHRRLRLPGAARDRAVQEMVGAEQGRRHHGLGHRRYRGADRLRRQGQDPLHLGLLCRRADRPDRRQRQGQARAVQFLLRPELLGCGARHADLGGRGLEGQGQARQAEIRPHGRQPPLSERAEGGR